MNWFTILAAIGQVLQHAPSLVDQVETLYHALNADQPAPPIVHNAALAAISTARDAEGKPS